MSDLMMTRFQSSRPAAVRTGKGHLAGALRIALRAFVTRQELLELTPRGFADIGVSASGALVEAARLPWDIDPGPGRMTSGIWGTIQRGLGRARIRRMTSRLDRDRAGRVLAGLEYGSC